MTALDGGCASTHQSPAVDDLVGRLMALGAPRRGASLLVEANRPLALDVLSGDYDLPRGRPPVGPDGEVYIR